MSLATHAPCYAPIQLVSICVVAYKEAAAITHVFAALKAQDYPHEKIELVLVDGLSGDGTKELMEAFAADNQSFYAVKVLDNPQRVLPAGLNIAFAQSTGDALIRLDAHASIPPNFVRANVETLEGGEYVCGGLRPTILDPRVAHSAWAHTLHSAEESLFGSSIASYRRDLVAGEQKSVFHACYRREVIDAVGRFDERLVRTEDNDFNYRVRRAGFRIWYTPDIVSYQYVRASFKKMLAQKASNGYWIGRTLLMCPSCLSLYHLVPLAFVLALVVGCVLGLCVTWLPLVLLACLYACVDIALSLGAALKASEKHLSLFALPVIMLSMHLAYGASTALGLLRGLIRRAKPTTTNA
jgi:glycosyltransferase involved in cell wall biosynthesis